MKRLAWILWAAALLPVACSHPKDLMLEEGTGWTSRRSYTDFEIKGQAQTEAGAAAVIRFCESAPGTGYEVLLQNGPIDGTVKTGSLSWFDFSVAVRGKNIGVQVNGVDVVCYTEPADPWRREEHAGQRIAPGRISFEGLKGKVELRGLDIDKLPAGLKNPADTLPPVNEQEDRIIRLQQRDFPVIDYHVHLKGGLTKEMAHAMSMNYGINYGVAPNAGEGGVGRMLADDAEVYDYYEEISSEPFLFGVQGEGRKWTQTFSAEALGIFEYLFTDAMTIIDHKGRISRIYRPEESIFDGIDKQRYMDHLVDQTVLILTNEPADIYANPTYLPDEMQADYDRYWTPERGTRSRWKSIPATRSRVSTSSAGRRNAASSSRSARTTWMPTSAGWSTPWKPSTPAA